MGPPSWEVQMQQAAWRGGYEWVEPKGGQAKGVTWQHSQGQHQRSQVAGKQGKQQQQRQQQRRR
eukprot:12437495-Alexandrium_andersonii.AAC.1